MFFKLFGQSHLAQTNSSTEILCTVLAPESIMGSGPRLHYEEVKVPSSPHRATYYGCTFTPLRYETGWGLNKVTPLAQAIVCVLVHVRVLADLHMPVSVCIVC